MCLCSLKFPSVVKSKATFQQRRPEVNETQMERGAKIRRLISLYHLFHVFVFMFIDFVCICVWDCVFVYLFFKANIASQDNQVTSNHASVAALCLAGLYPLDPLCLFHHCQCHRHRHRYHPLEHRDCEHNRFPQLELFCSLSDFKARRLNEPGQHTALSVASSILQFQFIETNNCTM